MSLKALSDYTFLSRYSRYLPNKARRETWNEAIKRVFDMHRQKYADAILKHPQLKEEIDFAEEQVRKKRVLAAQRTLQFAGEPIFKHNLRLYNCLTTHIDRPRVFQEMMYSLLCGCGVGFSVQEHHVSRIPKVQKRNKGTKTFVIPDSIEGWADAIGVLMSSYFETPCDFTEYNGYVVEFDYSLIRPEGSMIAGQFKAPGPKGLEAALNKIDDLISTVLSENDSVKMRPIHCYDVIMHISDAVLSGGVRRSATLSLFSPTDKEMIQAKTGDWYNTNPQRARSNNSAALLKGHTTREQFHELMVSTKEFGEPGFIWVDDLEMIFNPCCEIGMIPKTLDGRSGWQSCNLTEINGKWCTTEENFYQACRASSIIGTLQAGYTDLKYLESASKEIFEYEALLGCSITGMMDNPEILFDPVIQKKGAKTVLEINEKIAAMIGIKPTARATAIKPAGSTSCVLGTASGIHPHHSKRYIRRVQANKSEFCLQETERINPLAVEESVWSANGTDKVISFLCEVPPGAIVKNQLGAVELLEKILLTQQNWVEYGTVPERGIHSKLRHNVSNTCFSSKERFLTNQGVKSFSEFSDGETVIVYDHSGTKRNAIIKNFGKQEIYRLILNNGKTTKEIETTKNHIWLACNKNGKRKGGYSNFSSKYGYKMVPTNQLVDMKSLQIPRYNISEERTLIGKAFCHGFVFGDGSKHYARENGSTHVKIYDSCRKELAEIFKNNTECSVIEKDDHIYVGKLDSTWKEIPKDITDPDYIFSFIAGWFAADGAVADPNDKQRAITLTHKDYTNIKWLYDHATLAGFSVHHPHPFKSKSSYKKGEIYHRITFIKSTMHDNFFINHLEKYQRWLGQKNTIQQSKFYKVVSVEATGRYEDVWCVVEPETSTFLLEDGIITHNCTVHPNEWDEVEEFIFSNQQYIAGISLLPSSGDLDYPQAPFSTVLTPTELVKEYGDSSVFASGLIVDGLAAFNQNLWKACDTVLGFGDILPEYQIKPEYPEKINSKNLVEYWSNKMKYDEWFAKKDWVRRVIQFSERYFNGNLKKTTHCLKHVSLWKTWCDLKREYVEIDWSQINESSHDYVNADTLGATACSGGKCELV